MKTVHIFTNIAPEYRQNLWEFLVQQKDNKYIFYYSDDHPLRITEIDFDSEILKNYQDQLVALKSTWISNKILIWQKGILNQVSKIKKQDIAVIFGDAYCLSNWISAIYLRLKKVKVVFWSHGLYGNENKLKLLLRKTFYKLANSHLLYERNAKRLMQNIGFNTNQLYVFFNSLDYDNQKNLFEQSKSYRKSQLYSFFENPELQTLIFIGRLTKVKKLQLLLEAVLQINKNKVICNLLFVGDGGERKNLEKMGISGVKNKWIHFAGPCFDEIQLSKYISQADLCVSPGNVGLTAIHSLSYGTPVCSHNNFFDQMPEVEAIENGKNGVLFQQGDLSDLIEKIKWALENLPKNEETHKNCRLVIDQFYNPYYQLSVLNDISEDRKPKV